SCSSTAPAAATATTTRRGCSTGARPSASSSAGAAPPSRTRGCSPHDERGLPLLPALSRGAPRCEDGRLRRDPRHQPAGTDALARHPRAARRELPRHHAIPRRRGEADARLHRRCCCTRGPDRLPCRGERRVGGRADRFPPALAHPGWGTHGEDGVSRIGTIEDEMKEAMKARDAERRDALRLILNALKSSEKELQRPLSDEEELQVLQRERKRRIEAAEAFR